MVTPTVLAAYDAAPAPSPRPVQLAVYFVEDGSPTELVGVENLDVSIENPTTENADAPELGITLNYDPADRRHKALLDACDEGTTVTLRVVIRDESGHAVTCREMTARVVRYRIAMHDRFRDEARYLRVNIDFEAVGALTLIS